MMSSLADSGVEALSFTILLIHGPLKGEERMQPSTFVQVELIGNCLHPSE
jgi:hypothetical protein